MQHSPIIHVMTKAAHAASKGVVRDFGEIEKLQISRKGIANFVTSADLRTEKILLEQLGRARPNMCFLSEESGESGPKNAKERFIIDPIDGTTNFIHAIPYFCISIAAQKRDDSGAWVSYAGIIYDPIHDELFAAEKGKGAILNQNYRLRVSENEDELLMSTTSPRTYRKDFKETASIFSKLTNSGYTLRCSGSAALDLAYVAAGRLDACWYHRLNTWDMAAGALLIEEAGGRVSRESGDGFDYETGSILASNGLIHQKLTTAIG